MDVLSLHVFCFNDSLFWLLNYNILIDLYALLEQSVLEWDATETFL